LDKHHIQLAKKFPAEPGEEQLVLIDDVAVNRKQMNCLFSPRSYVEDEVLTLSSILSDRTSLLYNEKIWWEIIPGHNF
jgi:hypothetical protein